MYWQKIGNPSVPIASQNFFHKLSDVRSVWSCQEVKGLLKEKYKEWHELVQESLSLEPPAAKRAVEMILKKVSFRDACLKFFPKLVSPLMLPVIIQRRKLINTCVNHFRILKLVIHFSGGNTTILC